MDRASLEQLLEQGLSLAAIGRRFDKHESTIAYWVKKHGLEAVEQSKHSARGGLEREQLERLVDDGALIAQIAEARKCVLLCSNCHAEVEDGMASVRDRRDGWAPSGVAH